jgi:hypothetical protein
MTVFARSRSLSLSEFSVPLLPDTLVRVNSSFIIRKHNDDVCNHINPPSGDRLIQCEACSKFYDQDENACQNMMEVQISAD